MHVQSSISFVTTLPKSRRQAHKQPTRSMPTPGLSRSELRRIVAEMLD